MKLNLIFENSGDTLTYNVVHNYELLEFFIEKCNQTNNNNFQNFSELARQVDKHLMEIHWALSKINEVLPKLIGRSFKENNYLLDYLNQNFLNNQHCEWVFSQNEIVNIDSLRHSSDFVTAKLGAILHEKYPDEIRDVVLAPALEKLGYLFPYTEVNLTVHRLETLFNRLEYSSANKWDIFENPIKNFYSANDICNFSFSYTYVGRQYYDKFKVFDDDLVYGDHYNYETLEFSFFLNLEKPQTIPFSTEFLNWCNKNNVPPITSQIPIANIENISEKLFDYRKILYTNAKNKNPIKLEIQ